jgi:hypothetical protein
MWEEHPQDVRGHNRGYIATESGKTCKVSVKRAAPKSLWFTLMAAELES